MYYVYAHVYDNREIIYIGKGKGGRAFAETGRKEVHKEFMLSHLTDGNFSFVVLLYKNLSESEALEIEAEMIRKYQPAYNNYYTEIWKESNKTRGQKGADKTKKKCKTPLGTFDSLTEAARAYNFKDAGSILYRIKNKVEGFVYVENETEIN